MTETNAAAARARLAEPEQLSLFDLGGGVDLAKLRKDRAALALQARAPNTQRAYDFDWADFARWCTAADRRPLPATSDTVQLYLLGLAQLGRLPATMARRASAIAARHAAAGLASPVDADVREVLGGLRRQLGAAPRHAKAAVSVADLRAMLQATPRDLRGLRDRALLLCGFATSLRRSELVSIDLADVRFEARGFAVRLGRSKTDQAGVGRWVGAHYGRRALTCPVRALQRWMRARGSWPGALFAAVDPQGRLKRERMPAGSVGDAVKAAAVRAGLDPARFGAHSLRAGLVTAAGGAGVGDLAIMERTGHKSARTLARYMRAEHALDVDPLAGLL